MIDLPLNVDFSGKVVVITGAGGVLCGDMAKAFAQAGAKVAALDLNEEAVKKVAEECNGICKGYKANVLEPESLEAVAFAAHHIPLQISLTEQVQLIVGVRVDIHRGRVLIQTVADLYLRCPHLLLRVEHRRAQRVSHSASCESQRIDINNLTIDLQELQSHFK